MKRPILTMMAGLYSAETRGDRGAAVGIYATVVAHGGVERSPAAAALLRLGLEHHAAGHALVAATVFHSLARLYPDQSEPLARIPPDEPGHGGVTVIGFRNLLGRAASAWLSSALTEMLATELSTARDPRTLPPSVLIMRARRPLYPAGRFGQAVLSRLGAELGDDRVVVGSFVAGGVEGAPFRLDVQVQDVRSGATVVSMAESGEEKDVLEIVARTGRRLLAGCRLNPRAGSPSDPPVPLEEPCSQPPSAPRRPARREPREV